MKPHITNLTHKKFAKLIEDTIQRVEEISIDEKHELSEKITELKNNKQILEEKSQKLILKVDPKVEF